MPKSKDPLTIALNYLKYRLRTVAEIENKLREKGIDEPEIKKTIQALKKYQLLDDDRFARSWIRQRSSLKPTGRYRLTQELIKLGIPKSQIDQICEDISENPEMPDESSLALEAGRRKLRLYGNLPEDIFKRRMLGFLQRRGFNYSVAKQALAILEKER